MLTVTLTTKNDATVGDKTFTLTECEVGGLDGNGGPTDLAPLDTALGTKTKTVTVYAELSGAQAVTMVKVPTRNAAPATVTATGTNFTVAFSNWTKSTPGRGDVFEASSSYTATATFTADSGYQFVDGVTFAIAGSSNGTLKNPTKVDATHYTATYAFTTPDRDAYTATNTDVPTVAPDGKHGGNVTLTTQTIAGETVEYAHATTDAVPTTGWQTSTKFTGLAAGSHYFFARVKENADHKAGAVAKSAAVTVYAAPTLSYSAAPTAMTYNDAITAMTATAAKGSGGYSYAVTTGTLPAGLQLDETSGKIYGTPTSVTAATSSVTITVTDSEGITAIRGVSFPAVGKATRTAAKAAIAASDDKSVTVTAVDGQKYQIKKATETAPTITSTGWGTGVNFADLERNTAYKIYTYLPGNDNYKDSAVESTPVTTAKTTIGGSVSIDKVAPVWGDTLTANVTGITPAAAQAGLTYKWYRGADVITGADKATYTVTTADVGKTLKVEVTGTGSFQGTQASAATAAVAKKAAPTNVAKTYEVYFGAAGAKTVALTDFNLPSNIENAVLSTTYEKTRDEDVVAAGYTASTFTVNSLTVDAVGKYDVWTVTITSANYKDITATVTVKAVNKTPLTISGVTMSKTSASYTYGETVGCIKTNLSVSGATTPAFDKATLTYTYSGTCTDGTTFITGTKAPTKAGSYTLTVAVPDSNETYMGKLEIPFSIGPKPVTAVRASSATITKVYDGSATAADVAFTVTGVPGDGTLNITASGNTYTAGKNVGTGKNITLGTKSGEDANYAITYPAVTGNITPWKLTISGVSATDRQYNGAKTVELTGGTLSDCIFADKSTLGFTLGQGSIAAAGVGSNKAVTTHIALTGDAAGNYTLTQPTDVTVTISPKEITATCTSLPKDRNKVYNGSNAAANIAFTADTGVAGDGTLRITASGNTYADKNVGTDKHITLGTKTGVNANYDITYPELTGAITAKALTIPNVRAINRTYDGTKVVNLTSGSILGKVGNEDVDFTLGQGKVESADASTTAKSVTITSTLTGNDKDNYTLTQPTGVTVVISKKPVTATCLDTVERGYDNTRDAGELLYRFAGVKGNVYVTVKGSTFADKSAGENKAITLGNDRDGDGLANYEITYSPVKGTIVPRDVNADIMGPETATYGTSYTPHSAAAIGAIVGDTNMGVTVLYNGSATRPTAAGTYTLTGKLNNGNYKIVDNIGTTTFTINPADITTLTYKSVNCRDTDVSVKTYALSNFGTVPSGCQGGTWSYVSSVDDNSILNGTPAISTDGKSLTYQLKDSAAVGDSAQIKVKFTPNANYNAKDVTLIVDIIDREGAAVTVSMADWTYGQSAKTASKSVSFSDSQPRTNAVWTLTYTGTMSNGEEYAASTTVPTNPGIYTVKAVYEDDNHKGENTASFIISKKALTYTGLTVVSKVFDNLNTATVTGTLRYVGVVTGDTVTDPTYDSVGYADVQVGTGKMVYAIGIEAPAGPDSWKYTADDRYALRGNITAAPSYAVVGEDVTDKRIVKNELDKSYDGYSEEIKALATSSNLLKTYMKEQSLVQQPKANNFQYFSLQKQTLDGNKWTDTTTTGDILIPRPAGCGSSAKDTVFNSMVVMQVLSNGSTKYFSAANGGLVNTSSGVVIKDVEGNGPIAVAWNYTAPSSSYSGYTFTKGANATFKGTGTAEFRVDHSVKDLTGVSVDNRVLRSGKDYTTKSGTNAIILTSSFMKTLGRGNYSLYLTYKDGYATTVFTISDKGVTSAQTGDMGIALYGVMALASASGAVWVSRKKKEDDVTE